MILPLAVYWRLQVRAFAKEVDPSSIRASAAAHLDDVDIHLIYGLSEAMRISVEAVRSLRSRLVNAILFTLILGIFAWLLSFLLLNFGGHFDWTLLLILTLVIWGAVALYGLLAFERSRIQVEEVSQWTRQLKGAIAAELTMESKGRSSSLELLLSASVLVPRWLHIGQRDFSERHPAASLIFVLVTMGALSSASIFYLNTDLLMRFYAISSMSIILIAESFAYLHLAKADDRKLEESTNAWIARQAMLQRALDDLLERG